MKRISFLCLMIQMILSTSAMTAQSWSIEVQAEGYSGEHLLLAYYLGNAQYVKDTAVLENAHYHFSGEDTLESGVYLVIFPPDNQYFQLLIAEDDTDIRVKVKMDDVTHPYQIEGSEESNRFYDYVAFLQKIRPQAEELRKAIDTLSDVAHKEHLTDRLLDINASVRSYQEEILQKHPNSLTAVLIASNLETDIPEFHGTTEEVQMQTYRFVKDHYFDHIPMKDPRVVRTPILHQRVEYYLNKLTHQIPDSISESIDIILGRFDPDSEAFRVYLVYFLNTYAKSNIVGMDAVYVHLADKYYGRGMATWTEEELLQKILKNAETLRPLLIGKIAPDLQMLNRENQPIRLHDVEAPYIVLFFWDPECGHCKKSIPDMRTFYESYHPKGVEIFSVCTSLRDEVGKCWESIDERGMGDWMNVVDPYLRSRFKQIYDIRTTPQIYILDKNKKIVMKKIGAESLPEVMDRLMENGS